MGFDCIAANVAWLWGDNGVGAKVEDGGGGKMGVRDVMSGGARRWQIGARVGDEVRGARW